MKKACITLDLEPFFGISEDANLMNRLMEVFSKHGVKLTVFVVGKLIESRPDIVRLFQDYGAEFELHSYSHMVSQPDSYQEIMNGKAAYEAFFGCSPKGYRAPWLKISQEGLRTLNAAGFIYDSSITPSVRPGVYNYLNSPTSPFRIVGHSLLELPVTATPGLRLPFGLAYLKLIGELYYKMAMDYIYAPDPLIFYMHLQDLKISHAMNKSRSIVTRSIHRRNVKNSMNMLDGFLSFLTKRGYEFRFMNHLASDLAESPSLEVLDMDRLGAH